jgi:predicted MPP superfamily phosphohydrolase
MKRIFTAVMIFAALGSGGSMNVRGQEIAGSGADGVSASVPGGSPVKLSLPLKNGSVRFAVIGDTGTGTRQQKELADVMVRYREAFPFESVLMLGDNMYGRETPNDFKTKFQDIYQRLLDNEVKFYAALGNHDESNQRFYELFNMKGEEYYRLKQGNVAFYVLNSNYMDKRQIKWLEDQFAQDTSEWKIAFFHHPPYSSGGKHGSSTGLRVILEPLFMKYGINAVFTGHDHFYERVKPQKGIHYFVSGAGGKLRKGNVKGNSPLTEKAFDRDLSFMLLEVVEDQMHFQVISRTGETVDSGVLINQRKKSATSSISSAGPSK